MPTTTATDEILAVLTEYADALGTGEVERAVACFSADAVHATLAPPLVQPNQGPAETAAGLRAWLSTFDGPVEIAYRDPAVVADGDVAFVFALASMTATPAGTTEPFTLWFRATYGLRRTDSNWALVHQHQSVPFHMDGSFAAAVGLTP